MIQPAAQNISTAVALLFAIWQFLLASTASANPSPTGIINIESSPEAAMVYIDNLLVGEAPLSQYVSPGEHTVRVVMDNHTPFVRRLEVPAGQALDFLAQLEPGNGSIEFQTNARGAQVSLNEAVWPLPVRLSTLDEGSYTWELTAPGHEPQSGSFVFTYGRNIFIYRELQSSRGIVSVDSTPHGAQAWLDGEQIGFTPVTLEGIPSGHHVVTIEKNGFSTAFRPIDTSDGSRADVMATLTRQGSRLTINTDNPEATVSIEGALIGMGTTVRIPRIERGTYQVSVRAPGHKPARTRMDIETQRFVTYSAHLQPNDATTRSRLLQNPPLTKRWTFWATVGASTTASTIAIVAIARALQPTPIPDGDIVITLP